MDAIRPRLHPLLTVAAISVTVLSAVGVGAMTGLLPHSSGTMKDAEPVVAASTPAPQATPVMKPKPVHRAAKPQPTQPVQVAEAAPIAQAPLPAVPAGVFGTVESVKESTTPGDGGSGVGAIGGGIAGAVLGNQFGHGSGRSIMTVLGAAGGALAGKEIEKQHNATKRWEVSVRLDDGSYRTLSSPSLPYWHTGDRVRFLDGKLQPA
jgi:outer membrane lipoprotein SlyB